MSQPVNQNNTEITILPENLSNPQYDLNIDYLSANHPQLLLKIQQQSEKQLKLCLNPDQSINVLSADLQQLLFPSSQEKIDQLSENLLSAIKIHVRPNTSFSEISELAEQLRELAPISTGFQNKLLALGGFAEQLNHPGKPISINRQAINFLPLLRIYGIGLGQHITAALQRYDVATLVIYEQNIELFIASLFTTPWHIILASFDQNPNRNLCLILGQDALMFSTEELFLGKLHPYFSSAHAALSGSLEHDYRVLQQRARDFDLSHFFSQAGGFYEDQVSGLKASLDNIINQRLFFNGQQQPLCNSVFVVGSGPSLNESIEYIKKNYKKALIIACGSAISALINHGITPHIHVLQERNVDRSFLLNYTDADTYSGITCIKLNVVGVDVDDLYRQTLVLQKANDPGSSLLAAEHYPVSHNVSPTVTNLGVVLTHLIKPRNAYLFGLDYGSSEEYFTQHANGTTVLEDDQVDQDRQVTITGNFGKTIYTNEYLIHSRKVAAIEIQSATNINWYNIGSGALIEGTEIRLPQDLAALTHENLQIAPCLQQLERLFSNHYDPQSIIKDLRETQINNTIEYLQSLLSLFETIPDNRVSMMKTIEIISRALGLGSETENNLPKMLFAPEFTSFFNNIVPQIAITHSDQDASELYRKATTLLAQHIDTIFQDFVNTIEYYTNIKQDGEH